MLFLLVQVGQGLRVTLLLGLVLGRVACLELLDLLLILAVQVRHLAIAQLLALEQGLLGLLAGGFLASSEPADELFLLALPLLEQAQQVGEGNPQPVKQQRLHQSLPWLILGICCSRLRLSRTQPSPP